MISRAALGCTAGPCREQLEALQSREHLPQPIQGVPSVPVTPGSPGRGRWVAEAGPCEPQSLGTFSSLRADTAPLLFPE